MVIMNLKEACAVSGLSRYRMIHLMESGWDIGEINRNPKTGGVIYTIFSHKLAEKMQIPEQEVLRRLAKYDTKKRYNK